MQGTSNQGEHLYVKQKSGSRKPGKLQGKPEVGKDAKELQNKETIFLSIFHFQISYFTKLISFQQFYRQISIWLTEIDIIVPNKKLKITKYFIAPRGSMSYD